MKKETLIENAKIFGKISGKATLAWLKVAIIGSVIMLADIIISIILFGDNHSGGAPVAAHGGILGAIVGFFTLFLEEFWTALLLLAGIISPVIYTLLANKNAMASAIYNVWKYKLADFVEPKIDYYTTWLIGKQPKLLEEATSWGLLKIKFYDAMKKDQQTPRLQKKVIGFGLKKIQMGDVDFSDPDLSLADIISSKIKGVINDFAEPSLMPVWILTGVNILLIILAIVFNHH